MGRRPAQLVGFLSKVDGGFRYAEEYLALPRAQAISQSLPLRPQAYDRAQAMPYFEGLVPEGEARRLMAAELKCRADDYIAMLDYCGLDVVGDLAITQGPMPEPPHYEPVDNDVLRQSFVRPGGMARLNGSNRLSLAGTQNKVGLAHLPGSPLATGWLRPQASAASTHILKVSSSDNISYIEYLCTAAAARCGIAAARTDLLDLGAPVICSERFDRKVELDGGDLVVTRLHQEDFTQAFGLTSGSKYAELEQGTARSLGAFLDRVSSEPIANLLLLAKISVYNYLIGNCDNHLKNLSLLYNEDWTEVRLAPAYDLVCTTWFPDLSRDMGMAVGGVHDIDAIGVDELRSMGNEMGVPKKAFATICHELADAVEDALRDVADEAPDDFDEVYWKADDVIEDLASRRELLSKV